MDSQKKHLEALLAGRVWEYLVGDFLETACALKPKEQDYLIRELQSEQITADRIEVHPCFSISSRMVILSEQKTPNECWFFFPERQQMTRWKQNREAGKG